ncbi:MAG TPA: SPFH domain-containing protein [Candidatus Sulfotelmatobacter sp.]|nr:SPFH domain-containing protein [Candidatus Sulfotelmatobacter sp.]
MIREKEVSARSGGFMFLVVLALFFGSIWGIIHNASHGSPPGVILSVLGVAVAVLGVFGLTVVNPNQSQVVQLFGSYSGTLHQPGFWWVNPFTTRRRISVRVRNFESAKLKVNDHDGNPIEIAAVVVWRVVDTAEALFEVDNYENFVKVQTEAAVRNLASTHPYDAHGDGQMSLRSNIQEVAEDLKKEIQARLTKAGVEVIEARISHLAYAPEIASAMLQRQQASAIVAARTKIVEGAVGMVEMALAELSQRHVVELDGERRAAMVSNLLVVLCSDRHAQPVVNAGTIYQ